MNRTITAMYASRDQAERAADQVRALGVTNVSLHDAGGASTDASSSGVHTSIWDDIKSLFSGDDRSTYEEGVRRGRTVLTVRTDETGADRVIDVLDRTDALDVDAERETYRSSGFEGVSATTAAPAAVAAQDMAIPIVEEQIAVGKRDVVRGGARIRSYIVETPVEEQVRLREEHVHVERVPVGQPVANAADLLQERVIEVTERAEEAVVGKRAVVTEELRVRKDVDERVETVRDTVRRTEVEVDHLDDDRFATSDNARR